MKRTVLLTALAISLLAIDAFADLPGSGGNPVGSPYYWSAGSGYGTPSAYGVGVSPFTSGYHTVPVQGVYGSPAYGHSGFGLPAAGFRGHGHFSGDYYTPHFGPGYYRSGEAGHLRFPYYSYRAPWYFPGPGFYNRDTNFAW